VIVSSIEHESVLSPAHLYDCQEAYVDKQGVIDVNRLITLVNDQTVLVSVMYASNEVGTIQPLRQLSRALAIIRSARRKISNQLPLYLHTDAAQAANYLDLHVARLGVDLMTLNGGKIYGPKQSGGLFIKGGVELSPQILGGGQELGWRGGTENVAGITGFSLALELVQGKRAQEGSRLKSLQDLFFKLLEDNIPGVVVNGSRVVRLPNNVHVTINGQDNNRLLIALDEAGILAAAGSACSASNDEPSHVLKAMGLTDAAARSSLRFTMGRQTSDEDIRTTVDTLKKLVDH
jgi:cysteine desulfurase